MIKITVKQLKSLNACQSWIMWFKNQRVRSLTPLVSALLKSDHFDYARWLLSQLLTHPQKVAWSIQSAELVIDIFEKKYPNDKRPRKAIVVVKNWLKNPTSANANAAADAATDATYAAANAAYAAADAAYAAYAAADAANAATNANAAYADAATNATYAATNATYVANAAARSEIQRIICDNALRLLGEIK